MKIIFNLINCGLGNNGGSQTIVKSANVLSDLGHEVIIIDSMNIKYTWDKLKVPHLIIKNLKDVPNADVIIATGYKTVDSTIKLSDKCGKKYHWIRGWETWQMSENEIVEKVLKAPTTKIVNGISLQNKLKQFGFESELIRPGIDDDLYFETKLRDLSSVFTIGALFHSKHKTKNTELIFDVFKIIKDKEPKIKLQMFGANRKPKLPGVVDNYICQPNHIEKNSFYNWCHIWFAPTINDSLHIPPMEAMLTGCPIIALNHPMNGMWDYLDLKHSFILPDFKPKNIAKNIINLYYKFLHKDLKINDCRDYILHKIGNRKYNMIKMINFLNK